MSRYRQRHIAMQIQYEGENYFGFTSQTGGCEETVEKHIFEALLKLRLISDRHTCHYSRCGRTDKGVSALGQTIALKVRSSIPISVADHLMPKHPGDSVTVLTTRPVKVRVRDRFRFNICPTLTLTLTLTLGFIILVTLNLTLNPEKLKE
jgi:tRNA pseudouridine(38-40) synthase